MRRFSFATFSALAFAAIGALAPVGAQAKNACDLLTQADVEAALGVPMRAPERQIMGMCHVRSVGDHPYKQIQMTMEQVASKEEWEKHEREIDAGSKPTAVPGIGDAALFWSRIGDARLTFIKGRTAVSIAIDVGKMMPKPAETLPAAMKLGQAAAARLK